MTKKTAGIIMTVAFTLPSSKAYAEFLSYMDRSEAVRNENFQKYNLYSDQNRAGSYNAIDGAGETMFATYNDYMNDPLKTSSLFTRRHDQAPIEEVKYLKEYFTEAQKNESPLWSIVYSFRNEWLIKQGYLDQKTNELDHEKLIEAIRLSVESLEKKEGLKGEWSAAIHYNTGHIHIHVGYVEKFPTREWIYYEHPTDIEKTGWQFKGKFKQKNVNFAKRTFVNELIQNKDQLVQMEELLVKQKNLALEHSTDFLSGRYEKLFEHLYQKLPSKKNYWKYGYAERHGFKPELDRIVNLFLQTDGQKTMERLLPLLQKVSDEYEEAYGNPRNKPTYFHNQIYGKEGLYARIGNIILKEALMYAKQQQKGRVMGSLSTDDIEQLRLEQACIRTDLPDASLENFQSEEVYQAYNDLQSLEDQIPDEMEESIAISDKEYQEINDDFLESVSFDETDSMHEQKNKSLFIQEETSKKIDEAMSQLTDYFQKRDETLEERKASVIEQMKYEQKLNGKNKRAMYIREKDGDIFFEPVSVFTHEKLQQRRVFHSGEKPDIQSLNFSSSEDKQFFSDDEEKQYSSDSKDKQSVSYKKDKQKINSNLDAFSRGNQRRILEQYSEATLVYGSQQWRLKNRKVKEDELSNGIRIVAPRRDEMGYIEFIEILVYDISQTEELPLHERNKNDEIESKRPKSKVQTRIGYNGYQPKNQEYELKKIMNQLRKSCDRSLQHYLNQRAYEEMEYAIEHNL